MPTALRKDGYRFFFFSREGSEPPHVHVENAEKYAKFWLAPVTLARNRRFLSRELGRIRRIIEENQVHLQERWNEHVQRQG
jgi:hypothetical protein